VLTADSSRPGRLLTRRGEAFDERLQFSFFGGAEKRGYRLIGISYYSTARKSFRWLKCQMAVQMIRELAKEARLTCRPRGGAALSERFSCGLGHGDALSPGAQEGMWWMHGERRTA